MNDFFQRYSPSEQSAYLEGQKDATTFRANRGDIHQTLFKAEAEYWRIIVGYDDVDIGTYISVTFKDRLDRDGCPKNVTMPCGTAAKAMARAGRFIARHAPAEPHCDVDY